MFSSRFDKQDEDDQVLDEIDLYLVLSIIRNFRESDNDIIDIRSQTEQQTENKQSKDNGWRFDKNHFNDNICLKSYWVKWITLVKNSFQIFSYFEKWKQRYILFPPVDS